MPGGKGPNIRPKTILAVHSSSWNNWQPGCFYNNYGRNVYFNSRGTDSIGRLTATARRPGAGQLCIDNSGPGATCNHVNKGTHTCTCAKGYVGDGKLSGTSCTDLDGCKNAKCPTACPAPFASRSVRRALLTSQVNPGSPYRCRRST